MDRSLATSRSLFALGATGTAPEWVQLTPSLATFSTRDGRGPFTIRNAADVIRTSLQSGPIGIDYDHATDLAAKAGISAPAAGWIEEIAQHGPNNEPGLWGRVKWTPKGGQAVGEGEYRYISPVLLSNKQNDLIAIGRAALTNDPALVMKGLFSVQEMDEVNRQSLCDALGIPGTSSDDDITSAIKKGDAGAKKKLASALGVPETATDDDLMAAVKKVGVQATNMSRILEAAGLAANAALDEATTVALCAKLKGTAASPGANKATELQGQVDELQKQLASLNARLAGNDAKTEVEAAIAGGKLAPAQKEWAVDYCSRDPAGFKSFIGTAPKIVAAGALASHAVPEGGLTPAEQQLCAALGVSEDKFKAERTLMTRAAAGKEGAL
ncbi:MAG: phage protease [Rhizomicrobium sp.]